MSAATVPAGIPTPTGGSGRWDLLVVGGGTAGLVAAQTAAAFGASVLLVERARTGGDCLYTGCVPSKSLLAAAHAVADGRAAARFGVRFGEPEVDFAAVMRHVQAAIRTIEPVDSPDALRKAGVVVGSGNLEFTGPDTAEVEGGPVRFRQAVIATGSSAAIPPIDGLGDASPLTSDTVWSLSSLPRRLLVLGGGTTGCELGQAFARLGAAVVLVEADERLLGSEDADAAAVVTEALRTDGITVHLATALRRVRPDGSAWYAELTDGRQVGFDHVLVATGRRPRTEGLGLDRLGVRLTDGGYVDVDAALRTSNPRVWAAGDVTGFPQYTHTAGVHGSTAASNAVLGVRRTVSLAAVPGVTYTQPELASVGIGADEAAESSALRTRVVSHSGLDRAIAEDRTEGFSRLTVDRNSRIVGATIVGPRAGESLAELVLAINQGLTASDLAGSMHAYPTYSDGVWNAGIAELRARLARPGSRRLLGLLIRLRRLRTLGRG